MAFFHEADETLRRYIHLRHHRGEVRAQDLAAMRGARCRRRIRTFEGVRVCGGPRTRRRRSNGTTSAVCADCGQPWNGEQLADLVARPARHLSRGEATAAELKLAGVVEAWLRVARLVEPRPRESSEAYWRFVIEAWGLFLDARVHGREGVVEHGAVLFPELGTWWTEWHVRRGIAYGRDKVSKRIARGGYPGFTRASLPPTVVEAVSP